MEFTNVMRSGSNVQAQTARFVLADCLQFPPCGGKKPIKVVPGSLKLRNQPNLRGHYLRGY